MKFLYIAFLMAPSLLFGQSRFEGAWEMKMDTIELSGPPEEYLLQSGMYHSLTCAARVDVETDGKDQKVSGHANFDTIAIRIVDANSAEFIQKKDGNSRSPARKPFRLTGRQWLRSSAQRPLPNA